MTNSAHVLERPAPMDMAVPLAPTIERITEQLRLVVQSRTFRRATRLKGLLEYVVKTALNGEDSGQSRTARELFGKSSDFDPSVDPVIRVQFGRLRRMLNSYYATEGKDDRVLINLPVRKYTPTFEHMTTSVPSAKRIAACSQENNHVGGATTGRPLIAVMPFANLTEDSSHNAFCNGLTEEITNGLAAAPHVDVVASSSSFQFMGEHVDVREVGRDLGVPLILEGSVRIEDGQTRVIAQLARSVDGVALWSDSFEDEMNGSINTQKSIAQKVMDNLPLSNC